MFNTMARKAAGDTREAEELRRQNSELAKAVEAAEEREERLARELERALSRAAVAEEAEERLCAQLGELEAEAVAQALEYRRHVEMLSERLAGAYTVLRSSSLPVDAASVADMD